jgi:hypothetical protein
MTVKVSDLLGRPVLDGSGRAVAKVHDVAFIQGADFGDREALVLSGLVLGRGSIGVRLGYGSPDLTGPWLLRTVFGALSRHARFVAWQDVHVDGERITLRVSLDALPHPSHLPRQQP